MSPAPLVRGVLARGNTWSDWYPDGLKMSGAVVGNKTLKKGTWWHHLPDGKVLQRRTR